MAENNVIDVRDDAPPPKSVANVDAIQTNALTPKQYSDTLAQMQGKGNTIEALENNGTIPRVEFGLPPLDASGRFPTDSGLMKSSDRVGRQPMELPSDPGDPPVRPGPQEKAEQERQRHDKVVEAFNGEKDKTTQALDAKADDPRRLMTPDERDTLKKLEHAIVDGDPNKVKDLLEAHKSSPEELMQVMQYLKKDLGAMGIGVKYFIGSNGVSELTLDPGEPAKPVSIDSVPAYELVTSGRPGAVDGFCRPTDHGVTTDERDAFKNISNMVISKSTGVSQGEIERQRSEAEPRLFQPVDISYERKHEVISNSGKYERDPGIDQLDPKILGRTYPVPEDPTFRDAPMILRYPPKPGVKIDEPLPHQRTVIEDEEVRDSKHITRRDQPILIRPKDNRDVYYLTPEQIQAQIVDK